MKILFIGLGSIGKRHARLIKDNFGYELFAFRSNKNKKNYLDIKEIYNLDDIDKIKPNVAFITNPTSEHIKIALICAKKGINLFIEKPLSDKYDKLNELKKEIKKQKIKAYIAYCLRFHPVIKWLKEYIKNNKPLHITINTSSYLPKWRETKDHLKNYSALKKMGGGVILDLSHEIDYSYYLFGDIKNMKVNSKKISNVTVDSEDFADILIEFKSGPFLNMHLNFLSQIDKRDIIIDFKNSSLKADIINNEIIIYSDNKIKKIKMKKNYDYIYTQQLKYYFENITKIKNMNDIDEMMRIFKIIYDIRKEVGY